jgi:hypothetical protein
MDSAAETLLLSTAFFGPVHYFRAIQNAKEVYIEKHENFIKQTYRNRCVVLAANGPLSLVVPVEHGRKASQKISQLRIANHTPWQRNHWRSIVSAYRNSPYFDFYADEIHIFFKKEYTFLFDYNTEITYTILDLIKSDRKFKFTESFEDIITPFRNYRETLSPKRNLADYDPAYTPVPYTQVFEDKFPFVPGLSILDLLFCKGPETLKYL